MQPNDSDATDRDVKFEPTNRREWEAPEAETKTYGGPQQTGPSQTALFLIAIIVIILIVLIVYLIV